MISSLASFEKKARKKKEKNPPVINLEFFPTIKHRYFVTNLLKLTT